MIRILVVCEHNSARSQMAAAYLRQLGGERFIVESAGLEPGKINPRVIEVMREEGMDLSGLSTSSVFAFLKEGRAYDIVITVCSQRASESCPLFPGRCLRLNWPFPDPSALDGSLDEVLAGVREIRDRIKERVLAFIGEYDQKGMKIFLEQRPERCG